MDPITLIVTALAAGAAVGLKDTASSAVMDAYEKLKALVKKRLKDHPDGELALDRYEQAPATWRAPLEAELAAASADSDTDLLAAAQALMALAGEPGKYRVDVHDSRGVYVGDYGTQHNTFN